MSIKSRLRALERGASSAGYLAEACPECGRPDPKGQSVLVLDATAGEVPRECSRCECLLDKNGRSLGPNGQVVVLVNADDESLERVIEQEGPDGEMILVREDGSRVYEHEVSGDDN